MRLSFNLAPSLSTETWQSALKVLTYRTTPVCVIDFYNSHINPTIIKVASGAARCLHPKKIVETGFNSLKAKVLPLSNPAGWDEQKRKVKKEITLYRDIIAKLNERISLPNRDHRHDKIAGLKKLKRKCLKALKKAEQHDRHLDKVRLTEFAGRFSGYAGNTVQMVAATSGILHGACMMVGASGNREEMLIAMSVISALTKHSITLIAINKHFKSALGLPNQELRHQEIKKAATRALCTLTSIAALYYFHDELQMMKQFVFNNETNSSIKIT